MSSKFRYQFQCGPRNRPHSANATNAQAEGNRIKLVVVDELGQPKIIDRRICPKCATRMWGHAERVLNSGPKAKHPLPLPPDKDATTNQEGTSS